MKTNLEIEFKCFIDEKTYLSLLKEFGLEGNIFQQTNHYFDTESLDLINNHLVLRIRQKGENYKLTSKSHSTKGAFEKHLFLNVEHAQEMLKNGFNAAIIDLPYDVKKVAELTTERASIAYKSGKLFFDKSTYYGHTDYEIEYEADSKEQGKQEFKDFLDEHKITYVKSISKSKRAYTAKGLIQM